MKVKIPQSVSNVETFEDLRKYSDQSITGIVDVVNGRLDFTDNISVSIVQFKFPTANATYAIPHTLGKVPTGYIPVQKKGACDIYDGSGTNTGTNIYLKATVDTTVTIMVF